MSSEVTASREFEQLIREVADATSVAEDDVRKVLREIATRQTRKLAAELSSTTSVPEGEVAKVLDGLGLSDALLMVPLGAMRHIKLDRLQGAVRDALVQVVM